MEQIAEYAEQISNLNLKLNNCFPDVIGRIISQYVGSRHQESLQELSDLNDDELDAQVEFFEFNFGGAVPLVTICEYVIEHVQPWSIDFEVFENWMEKNVWQFQKDILASTTRYEKINNLYRCLLYFYDWEFQNNYNLQS